jgi:hypothetical protein
VLRPCPLKLGDVSIDLALYLFWALLWACIPECKDFIAEVRSRVDPGINLNAYWLLKQQRDQEARSKTSGYLRRYSKVERHFKAYWCRGEQEERELRAVFEISRSSLSVMRADGMLEMLKAMQVPNDPEVEWRPSRYPYEMCSPRLYPLNER